MTSLSFEITRREFIVTNLAASLAVLAQKRADQQLSSEERDTLLAMARTIFPHDQAADMEYVRAIAIAERTWESDNTTFLTVLDGIKSIEWTCGGRFCTIGDAARVKLLSSIKNSRFFKLVYRDLLNGLY